MDQQLLLRGPRNKISFLGEIYLKVDICITVVLIIECRDRGGELIIEIY